MLTDAQYAETKARHDAYEAWRGGRTCIPADAIPPVTATNDDRSAIEVYEFCRDKPDRYFVYVSHVDHGIATPRLEPLNVTTWTGELLGRISSYGPRYRDNFGGIRQSIHVRAITGEVYHGTYFASSGDYARIRKSKRQPKSK